MGLPVFRSPDTSQGSCKHRKKSQRIKSKRAQRIINYVNTMGLNPNNPLPPPQNPNNIVVNEECDSHDSQQRASSAEILLQMMRQDFSTRRRDGGTANRSRRYRNAALPRRDWPYAYSESTLSDSPSGSSLEHGLSALDYDDHTNDGSAASDREPAETQYPWEEQRQARRANSVESVSSDQVVRLPASRHARGTRGMDGPIIQMAHPRNAETAFPRNSQVGRSRQHSATGLTRRFPPAHARTRSEMEREALLSNVNRNQRDTSSEEPEVPPPRLHSLSNADRLRFHSPYGERRSLPEYRSRYAHGRSPDGSLSDIEQSPDHRMADLDTHQEQRYTDGLGDRNRSPSPNTFEGCMEL